MTKFGTVTQLGRGIILRVRHTHIPTGVTPASQLFGTPDLLRNGLTHSDEIWFGNMCGE